MATMLRRARSRRCIAVGALAAVLVATASPSSAGAGFGFAAATTLPGSQDGNEPSIAISTTGVRYASWQSPGRFATSPDGVAWTDRGEPDANAVGDVTNAVDAAGAVYNAQICGGATALHTCVYRSVDGGKTWTQRSQLADMHPGASDRPWIDVWPHTAAGTWDPDTTTVYLEFHTFSPDDLVYVTTSRDGGATFSPPVAVESDTNAVRGSGCNTIPGGIAVDEKTGDVFAGWLSGDDVGQNVATGCNYSEVGPFTKAWVAVSNDHGVTWTSHLAWHGAYDASTNVGDNADHLFGVLAVDRAEQVHVMLGVRRNDDPAGYVASCAAGRASNSGCSETPQRTDLVLATSPDKGAHWTEPFTVNATPGSFFMPWIAAGSAGMLDAVYYRSATLTPNAKDARWNIAAAQITGAVAKVAGDSAVYASTPAVAETLLEPGIVHTGGICSFGIFCSAVPDSNRNLADSIAIALDPGGGANAVWSNDQGPKELVRFACQDSGPSAFIGSSDLAGCYRPPSIATAVRVTRAPTQVLGKRVTRVLATTGENDGRTFACVALLVACAIAVSLRRRWL
jgi:hypothetical protein